MNPSKTLYCEVNRETRDTVAEVEIPMVRG